MTDKKDFRSIEEVHAEFLPNMILDDLTSNVLSCLYPSHIGQENKSRISKNKANPKTGTLEFVMPQDYKSNLEEINNIIKETYTRYGFNVVQSENKGMIMVSKEQELYWINLFDGYSKYTIYVGQGVGH